MEYSQHAQLPIAGRLTGPDALRGLVILLMALDFGRVPLFFYLLHIPLIHGLAGLWKTFEGPEISVSLCYLIWLLVMLILYFPCRWFAEVKTQAKGGWTSYF